MWDGTMTLWDEYDECFRALKLEGFSEFPFLILGYVWEFLTPFIPKGTQGTQ